MTEVGLGERKAGSIERWSGTDIALLYPTHNIHGMCACMTLLHHSSFFKKTSSSRIYLSFPVHTYLSLQTTLVSILSATNKNVGSAVSIPSIESLDQVVSVLLCIQSVRARV
jgi:hypothetical protein